MLWRARTLKFPSAPRTCKKALLRRRRSKERGRTVRKGHTRERRTSGPPAYIAKGDERGGGGVSGAAGSGGQCAIHLVSDRTVSPVSIEGAEGDTGRLPHKASHRDGVPRRPGPTDPRARLGENRTRALPSDPPTGPTAREPLRGGDAPRLLPARRGWLPIQGGGRPQRKFSKGGLAS